MLHRYLALLVSFAVLPLKGQDQQLASPLLLGSQRKSGIPDSGEGLAVPLKDTLSGFVVDVSINGNFVPLVLDTGFAVTSLTQETAEKLGLEPMKSSLRGISTTGEPVMSQVAQTRRINIGDAWTMNEPVFITKLPTGFAGVLGMSSLADWDIRIDPAMKMLTLFPRGRAPHLEKETVVPLTCKVKNPVASASNPHGFRMLELSVPVRVNGHELSCVLDTGYGGTLQLSEDWVKKHAPNVMSDASPVLASGVAISGRVAARVAKIPEFSFGMDTLRDLPARLVSNPEASAEDLTIVGLNLLRHYVMTFCLSTGELRLKSLGTVQDLTRRSTAGINFRYGDDGKQWFILSVVPDGAAAKAGLKSGDEVLALEGHPVTTITPERLASLKQMPPGTRVKVRYRRGLAEPVDAQIILQRE